MIAAPPDICFRTEPLTDALWDELMPLMAAHCAEVGPFRDLPFNPNKPAYERMWRAGALAIFTVRDGERLIGYAAFFVSPSLHHFPAIFAQADVLYVAPDERYNFIGLGLMRWVEVTLRVDWRVDRVCMGSKSVTNKSIAPLLSRLDYAEVDSVWWKELTNG